MAKKDMNPIGPMGPDDDGIESSLEATEERKVLSNTPVVVLEKLYPVQSSFVANCLNCKRDTLFAVITDTPSHPDPIFPKLLYYFCSFCGTYTRIK